MGGAVVVMGRLQQMAQQLQRKEEKEGGPARGSGARTFGGVAGDMAGQIDFHAKSLEARKADVKGKQEEKRTRRNSVLADDAE